MSDIEILGTASVVTPATSVASKTACQLIDEVERLLLLGNRDELNVLNAAMTDTTTKTLTIGDTTATGIDKGAVIEVDLEMMRVRSRATGTVTVYKRGDYGSTAATHVNGELVRVNPKLPRFSVFQAINQEIASASAEGLYQMKSVHLTYNAAYLGYDLTSVTDMLGAPYEVLAETGTQRGWDTLNDWRFEPSLDTTDFASGKAIFTHNGYSGKDLRVLYKAPFGQVANCDDNVTAVTGFPATAQDILVYGAAARLVASKEPARNFMDTQGQPRRAEEVPSGAVTRSAAGLLAIRNSRLQTEKARLLAMYPPRLRR